MRFAYFCSTGGLTSPCWKFKGATVELRGSVIMAKILGVFGTKTCSFIKENKTKNGPLVFRTVLCSKHDEKLGNCQRKTLRQVLGCGIVRIRSIFVCQMLELARNHMILLLGKLCDRNLYSTINFAEITGSAMFKWYLFWLDVSDFLILISIQILLLFTFDSKPMSQ